MCTVLSFNNQTKFWVEHSDQTTTLKMIKNILQILIVTDSHNL